jgi:hypothetical protein
MVELCPQCGYRFYAIVDRETSPSNQDNARINDPCPDLLLKSEPRPSPTKRARVTSPARDEPEVPQSTNARQSSHDEVEEEFDKPDSMQVRTGRSNANAEKEMDISSDGPCAEAFHPIGQPKLEFPGQENATQLNQVSAALPTDGGISTVDSSIPGKKHPSTLPDAENVESLRVYDISDFPIGFIRMKPYPGVVCSICKEQHLTAHHDHCIQCFEVFAAKLSSTPGNLKASARRGTYKDCDCRLGEFRDHQENPESPQDLQPYDRPWDMTRVLIPFPLYYYFPQGQRSPNKLWPPLPDKLTDGVKFGLVNKTFGINWSLKQIIPREQREQRCTTLP